MSSASCVAVARRKEGAKTFISPSALLMPTALAMSPMASSTCPAFFAPSSCFIAASISPSKLWETATPT